MERLLEVVQRRARERAQRFVGRTVEVLVEGPSRTDPERLRGRTRHNKAVNFTGLAAPGELTEVRDHRRDQPDALGSGTAGGTGGELREGSPRGGRDFPAARLGPLTAGHELVPEPGATGRRSRGRGYPDPLEPEPEPELSFEPEPMFGHGPLPGVPDLGGEPDFGAGDGTDGVEVDVEVVGVAAVGVVAVEGVGLVAVVLEELGAAAAPAIPETAPPAASAPATIVAPSSLDVFMRSNLLGRLTR